MSDEGGDVELFRSLETALQRSDTRHSASALAKLLSDQFVEFGSSGKVYDRTAVISALAGELSEPNAPLPQMLDFSIRVLAPRTVLVTYKSVARERQVLRSSIWSKTTGDWQLVFHQGTLGA